MQAKFKSFLRLFIILFEKVYDKAYRLFAGLPPLKRSQISANLFLGSQYNLAGLRKLKKMGITGIINMRVHLVYSEAQNDGIHYLHLPTPDNTAPCMDALIKGADFADAEIKNCGKVYIYCRQGLGRAPTMTIAYLMKTGLTFNAAFALVKKVRPFINPRPCQVERLKELERFYQKQW